VLTPTAAQYDAFAVAAPGLESIVESELKSLRASRIRATDGGIEFRASPELLYTANLHLRVASRILVRLTSFRATSFAELERRAGRIPWSAVVPPRARVRLRVTCRKSRLYHSDAVAERIFSQIAEATGASDAVTTRQSGTVPDEDGADEQLFVVRIDRDECTVSADSSGSHLHQRGYRRAVTQAPLRENLAAAMVLASGWDERTPFIDPFCGSGTIAIEAALIARRLAPGRDRRFRFMDWPDFDAAVWQRVLDRARSEERPSAGIPIVGTDRSGWAMRAAAGNAERAGVAGDVQLERQDAAELEVGMQSPGWIVTNPPYGVRLGARDELRELYVRFGTVLRQRYSRWHVSMLSTDRRLDSLLRIPMLERFKTSNGGLQVRLLSGIVPNERAEGREPRVD
jgi:putative N6-adenine-specific DNA methylase